MKILLILLLILPINSSLNKNSSLIKKNRTQLNISRPVKAWVTFYQPTIEQCGSDKNITITGDSGRIGTCAISDKLKKFFRYGDSIEVLYGQFKGKYLINDRAASKGYIVDIWRPVSFKGAGCEKIFVKKI